MSKTTFADLIRESVISQALMTAIVGGGAVACQIITGSVPTWLQMGFIGLMGFYFGSGNKHAANRVDLAVKEALEVSPPEVRPRVARIHAGERPTRPHDRVDFGDD